MTNPESEVLERFLKSSYIRLIWSIVGCTVIMSATVLGVYYDMKEAQALDRQSINYLKERVDKIEAKLDK